MAEISAGQGCAYDSAADNRTYVSKGAPFDGSGTVDYLGMYIRAYASEITIKWSVYTASGNDLTTIDDPNVPVSKAVTPSINGCYTAEAPGDFTAFVVAAGNFLGAFSPQNIARGTSGGAGYWNEAGDLTDVTGVTFILDADGNDRIEATGESGVAVTSPTGALYGPLVGPLGGPV